MAVRDVVQAAAGVGGGEATYVEDVFSTYLYNGNGTSQTITNGIDLDGEGGMVWIKSRTATLSHTLFDTIRGETKFLLSNEASGELTDSESLTNFNANGFTVGSSYVTNVASYGPYVSWTFRKQPKFFDLVSYTGTGSALAVNHNLGTTPGCILVKCSSGASINWYVWHRGLPSETLSYLRLNGTNGTLTGSSTVPWNGTAPTDTQFFVNGSNATSEPGVPYVAYLFAHDAGGFGEDGTENIVSCGSFTTDTNGNATVDLGFEPQWLMIKNTNSTGDWVIVDVMRGWSQENNQNILRPNTSAVEAVQNSTHLTNITSTGLKSYLTYLGNTASYIYIAIRRPMKTPESGTEVFAPVAYAGNNLDNRLVDTGIITDMAMGRTRTKSQIFSFVLADRLRGDKFLRTEGTNTEASDSDTFMTPTSGVGNSFSAMNGFGVGNDATFRLNTESNQIAYAFRRAPGFFDVVAYKGDGTNNRNVPHNLGVAPQIMILKVRNLADEWLVWYEDGGPTSILRLNRDSAGSNYNTSIPANPTSSNIIVSSNVKANSSSYNYIAYLFATLPGVSKIGTYAGNGTSQDIDCGFSNGARFILIKRTDTTDSTGDWYVWDSARGIVAGNDPSLQLNTTVAEYTAYDSVDPLPSGFTVNYEGATEINKSGASYIFLAIA